jgi:NTP pyrophosphatase (non-canonical NTP hydrolase)
MGIIEDTVDSVRGRGFLDNDPGEFAKDSAVIKSLCLLVHQIGLVTRGLFRGNQVMALHAIRHTLSKLVDLEEAIYCTPEWGDAKPFYDEKVAYQLFKVIEELGEFANEFALGKESASTELADVFVTVCSVAAAFGRDNGYDLETEVRAKIGLDEQRGHLHGGI